MGNFYDAKAHCEGNYAMNRFFEKGVDLQVDAENWWEAKRLYMNSCMLCCMSNRPGATDCSSCPIRSAMLHNAKVFWNRMPKQEYAWVAREEKLL